MWSRSSSRERIQVPREAEEMEELGRGAGFQPQMNGIDADSSLIF
jgi:hypothetical protein